MANPTALDFAAHTSLSCHGPSPLLTGGLWNFIPWMAQVDHWFLLNRLNSKPVPIPEHTRDHIIMVLPIPMSHLMCCQMLQSQGQWGLPLSRLTRSCHHLEPEDPCNQVLWSWCSWCCIQESFFWFPGQLYLCILCLTQSSFSVNQPSCTYNWWNKIHHLFYCTIMFLYLNLQSRAHIARWCAKSNQPMNIIKDCEFQHLMKAGCPSTSLPTLMMVACDVKLSFEKCCACIDKILKVSHASYTYTFAGASGSCSLCNWCLDFPKPLCIYGINSSFAPQGSSVGLCFGYHRSSWGKFVGLHAHSSSQSLGSESVV